MNLRWCIVALMSLAASPLAAQDIQFATFNDIQRAFTTQQKELAALQARLTTLEDQLPGPVVTPHGDKPVTGTGTPIGDAVASDAIANGVIASAPTGGCCSLDDCPCEPRIGHFVAGAGVVFLHSSWSANPAMYTVEGAPNPVLLNFNGVSHEVDFSYGMKGAPVLWGGVVLANGWGLRTTWFKFSDGNVVARNIDLSGFTSSDLAATTPVIGTNVLWTGPNTNYGSGEGTLVATSNVGLNVFDFEVTKQWNSCCAQYTLFGGVRYAHLSQGYGAVYTDRLNADGNQSIFIDHNFNGVGPTAAMMARYMLPIYPSVGLYSKARGALLGGQRRVNTFYDPPFNVNVFPHTTNQALTFSGNSLLPVSEIEVGVDWRGERPRFAWYLQAAFVAQAWFGVGNSAYSTTAFNPQGFVPGLPLTVPTPSSSTDTSNLLLLGLKATAGFSF